MNTQVNTFGDRNKIRIKDFPGKHQRYLIEHQSLLYLLQI